GARRARARGARVDLPVLASDAQQRPRRARGFRSVAGDEVPSGHSDLGTKDLICSPPGHRNFVSTGAPALIVFVTGVFSATSASVALCSSLSAALNEIERAMRSAPVASLCSSTST